MSRTLPGGAACLLALVLCSAAAQAPALDVDARRLIDEGRATEAVKLIEERTAPDDRDADTWFLLAEAYHALMDEAGMLKKRGLATKMKRSLFAALESDPDHVPARQQLADFYYYAPWIVGGSKDEAAKQLEILERVAPGEAWATRGAQARNRGDLDEARDHYRKAVKLGPREPAHLFLLAVTEQQLDAYAESIRLLDELLEADPGHEKALYYRARASAMADLDLDRGLECARDYVEHCTECDDDDRAYGWWRMAVILKRQEQTDSAIAAYHDALRLNPELEGARKGLAELER